jgi:hypothetical protein
VSSPYRIGLDLVAGQLRIAQVSHQLGRPEICSLATEPGLLDGLASDVGLGLSMPDDEALVKTVRIQGQGPEDLRHKVFFELSQSVLEPESIFRFDCIETGNRHQIGLIYRKERIEARVVSFHLAHPSPTGGLAVDLRSIALARAYQQFCKVEPGDLVVLVNIVPGLASVVILYRQKIVSFGNTATGQRTGDDWFRPVAVALKTLINFKLAALLDDGVTVPLAALVVTGEQITEVERSALQKFFSARVVPFTPLPALIEQASRAGIGEPEQFLPALGLTVN